MSLPTRTSPRFVTINSKLPNELLTMVFQFLPFDDLKKVLLVCRLHLALCCIKIDSEYYYCLYCAAQGVGERWGSRLAFGPPSS